MERWLAANQQRISTLIVKADRYAKHGLVIDVMERAKLQLNKEEGQEIALAVSEDKL
jgi:biopolymer transport protein ExbD